MSAGGSPGGRRAVSGTGGWRQAGGARRQRVAGQRATAGAGRRVGGARVAEHE
ncbi:hypothetical protein SCB71_13435 [Herbiconiux sp. KACC 21604]|uniref:hypothetical protein n=1 Tax=unclassified Herbiconiux TaxID=2618217 RepID=UPI001490C248|nr:hypothetical protein [Herbiconiux sp. SALV-R1]QJU54162.1 hypothetical protein HL652_11385 [Herbiconiux sp. SALV-R1]WPO85215.1 hypothetical protein SCB71_13435 [Herbiconiux sp. KACC 21604]